MSSSLDAKQPTSPQQRIRALDFLRGFALLGILVVNVQAMAMPSAAYINPTAYGDFTGANYVAWWITFVFFDSKMMALFAMLFGAGVILICRSRSKKESNKTKNSIDSDNASFPFHRRRMLWLMVFGIFHAHLLWFGDILFCYGICGLVVYFCRHWNPQRLIIAGLLLIAVPSIINVAMDYRIRSNPAKAKASWAPDEAKILAELDAYRSGIKTYAGRRSKTAFNFETKVLLKLLFWRSAGLMLIGMAFFKTGIITGRRTQRFYIHGAAIGFSVGLPLALASVYWFEKGNWTAETGMFEAVQFNYWGSLPFAFGYLCLTMLFCNSQLVGRALKPIYDAICCTGRMALTNYLLQSAIVTTICYGHGLGYFGALDRVQILLIVIACSLFQILFSTLWLSRFRFGPLEWLWRCLCYRKKVEMFLSANQTR